MGLYIKQTGGEPAVSCPITHHHSLQHRGMTAGQPTPWEGGERQPKCTPRFCSGQAAPSPRGLSAVPQHAGDGEGFQAFFGGGSSSSAKLLVRDKEHPVKQIAGIWDCFTMGKPSSETLERSSRAPGPGLV